MANLTGFALQFVVAAFLFLEVNSLLYILFVSLDYRLTDRSMQVVLFGTVPIYRVGYSHIMEVKIVSYGDMLLYSFFAANWINRWRNGQYVLIRRKRWRPVLVTPANLEEFAAELRRRVHERTGEWPSAS